MFALTVNDSLLRQSILNPADRIALSRPHLLLTQVDVRCLPSVTVAGRREYFTEREIEKLIEAAGENRWGHRDATALLIAYRHGLRASELVALRWDDIDFQIGKLHVRRAKGGTASVHPLSENYAPCGG